MKTVNIAIVGATGAVGIEILKCLEKRHFPFGTLRVFASKQSAGKSIFFKEKDYLIEELKEDVSLRGIDIALFAAGSSISKIYAPVFIKQGVTVIDNSSAFRMHSDVPLIVPEVNGKQLKKENKLIANPNCSTIIATLPLKAIHEVNKLKRVIVSTYQAASGAGAAGMQELIDSTKAHLCREMFLSKVFPHVYGFNLFSHNTQIFDNGYNEEEMKMTHETRKIMELDELRISATCIRVPVLRTHCESLNIECEQKVDLNEIKDALRHFPGVQIVDNREDNLFPMPSITSYQDDVMVGRLRYDISDPTEHTFWLWVSGDQLLKGAALNAVQIAELVLQLQN